MANKLQKQRFEAFLKQDPESRGSDVTFVFGEKKLYAHKFMLQSVSDTFTAMFSDVWNNGEPIPITTYSYDDFYQFLHFLYFEECKRTKDNIFALVDAAEYYQIPIFKEYCDVYLSKLKCTLENVFQLLNAATTYSLDELKKSILPFIKRNLRVLLNHKQFLQLTKEACLEIAKIEQYDVGRETVFEKVYDWAENQAKTKKETDPNLNLDAATKEILSDFMPLFNFAKMDRSFATKYLVGKSLLPPGPELCALLLSSRDHLEVKVQIIDGNGKMMKGQFVDLPDVYEEIQKRNNRDLSYANELFMCTSREVRPSQQNLQKSYGIEWYLVYNARYLYVKRRNQIIDSKDYLIAELFAEDGFVLSRDCKIKAFFV